MSKGDIFRFINEVNSETLQVIINRLEFRDQDTAFTGMRDDYLATLDFTSASHILDVGCGTGVVTRALARRDDFSGTVVGVDHSPALIETARTVAAESYLDHRIEFRVGDIHDLEYEAASFDIVIAHTVMSHITDPQGALMELARVTKPSGKIVIFDGDYASMTFAYPPDGDFAKNIEESLLKAVVNNPRVLRDLPLLLKNAGLDIVNTFSYVLPEIGTGSFWASAFETFGPLVAKAGLLPQEQVNTWLMWQRQAIADGVFFASGNFYTYIAQHLEKA